MSSRPEFALFAPELPWPATQGSRLLVQQVALQLASIGQVTLFGRDDGDGARASEALAEHGIRTVLDPSFRSKAPWDRLRRRVGLELRARLGGAPREIPLVATTRLRAAAREYAASHPGAFAVGVFWSSWPLLAQFAPERRALIASDLEGEALHSGLRLAGSRVSARRVRAVAAEELRAFASVRRLWCITEQDLRGARRQLLGSEADGRARSALWQVAIAGAEAPLPERGEARSRRDVLIYGNWSADFNRDGLLHFLRETWPAIHSADPELRLRVAGRGLDPERLAAPQLSVLGWVEDLRAEFERARCTLIPLRYAGGLRYRLLECMAAGSPVVCTPVAAAGSGAAAGEHHLEASTPEEWSACIASLAEEREAARLLHAAKRFVAERYGRERASAHCERLIREWVDDVGNA